MKITSKVIAERGRRQGRELGIDPSRIPPGQYLTTKFPVLTCGRNPPVDLARWSLSLDTVDNHCVTLRKSTKVLRRLEILDEDRQGFWQHNGYHSDGEPLSAEPLRR